MLEAIRKFGVEKRWVYGIVFGFVSIAFVGSMSIGGLGNSSGTYAAKVGDQAILAVEFNNAYEKRYRQYEGAIPDFDIKMARELNLRTTVLYSMIDRLLWLKEAETMGLSVSNDEVKEEVLAIDAFHVNGRFNSAHYKRTLLRIKQTPETFEQDVRNDLLVAKAKSIIAAGAAITNVDLMAFAQEDAQLPEAERAERIASRREGLLSRKQAQTVEAYASQLRNAADIEIFEEVLGI
ncbi:MAG: SurA N-terminal domain-containing protein [Leptospirillia bacterium]